MNDNIAPTTLYHTCLTWLQPDSIIRAGNYGRIIYFEGPNGRFWDRESVLESVRQRDYPSKPSRFKSSFVLDNIRAAHWYHRRSNRTGVLYEVEPVNINATWHAADLNYVQELPSLNLSMQEVAILYWEGRKRVTIHGEPGLICTEYIAETDLRVIRQVT